MAEKKKPYDDPSNWEYDGGSSNWTGNSDNLSPYMKQVSDEITKKAFPDGIEAFQKQREKKK